MIDLIWSMLNIAIVLFFLYILIGFLFRGKQIFEGKFKSLSIIVLILGVVQIISATNTNEKENTLEIQNNYKPDQPKALKTIVIEDNFTKEYHLSIVYSKENSSLIPIESNCSMTGLVSGFDWKFISIQTEKDKYIATGILNWNLFGIKIYSQEKIFKGRLDN